ncbi:protein of unknown function [Paraburkholderia dioscoreae]|uniref:Uncharacterized protein n=1 Tax=Paraburkholderia dioscoreae TaxID=2604047 RepID=A0A5Q4YYQ8_9BURK|nr:protein of unknown function [Paraburkholderia dioscoreae]
MAQNIVQLVLGVLAYVAAAHSDLAPRHPDDAAPAAHRARYEYLALILKGWSTELSIDVTSLGVQAHAARASSRKRAPCSSAATRASCRFTRA